MLACWFVSIQMKRPPGRIENTITLQAFSIQSSISFNKIKGKKARGRCKHSRGLGLLSCSSNPPSNQLHHLVISAPSLSLVPPFSFFHYFPSFRFHLFSINTHYPISLSPPNGFHSIPLQNPNKQLLLLPLLSIP